MFLHILKQNALYIIVFFLISFAVFYNSLGNQFAVIDDLPGYIENELIRSVPKSMLSLQLQQMTYGIAYHFFQINPLPLRVLALFNHAVAGTLLFFILTSLFNKRVAFISVCLFLVHPVTTEAINWISAQFYIVMAIFLYLGILSLIGYRKTGKRLYLYSVIILFALDIVLIRHAWVFIYPFIIIVFDYFFLERDKTHSFYKHFIGWVIPLVILFILFNFSDQYTARMLSRNETGKELQNQQALIPIIQGYPYSIYSMMRLYLFPQHLTVYYDGNKITLTTVILMYTAFISYALSIWYFFNKNKKIAGLLALLVIFLLPVFSPKKITWFITERYLYAGTAFFTTLLTLLLFQIQKQLKWQYTAFAISFIIFLSYTYRSTLRNNDWKTPETIAKATIQTSPYTVRPYNDLAGYYVLQNRFNDAKRYYIEALQVSPSMTAVRNLGHIYLETEFDPHTKTLSYPPDQLYNEAQKMIQNEEYYAAAYYLNEVLAQEPNNTDALNRIAELYVMYGKPRQAELILQDIVTKQIQNADTYYILAYIAFMSNHYEEAAAYANNALTFDPNHHQSLLLLQQL